MQLKYITLASALAATAVAQDQSFSETVKGNKDLSSLSDFLEQNQELMAQLDEQTNVTVLAPNNDAFDELMESLGGTQRRRRWAKRQNEDDINEDDDQQNGPGQDMDELEATLFYHVLMGTLESDQVTEEPMFVSTMLDSQAYTDVSDGQAVEIVKDGEDVKVISGLLEESMVEEADIAFSGGVIHIIDTALTIPEDAINTAVAADLSVLSGSLGLAKLAQALKNTPDVTIFAPSNDAFEAVGSAVEELSEDDLASLLEYHVVEGTVGYSSDLQDGQELDTMSGDKLTVTVNDDGAIFINGALVTESDVLISNGVLHVIDAVLNPEETEAPKASATEGLVAFPDAKSTTFSDITKNAPEATTTIGSAATGGSGGAKTTSSEEAAPRMTGAIGVAALFGAAGVAMVL